MFMKLMRIPSGEELEAFIEELLEEDYKELRRSNEFSFDWETEKTFEVYKIFLLTQESSILGVMSLIDRPDEYRIHLNLLEVSKSNMGRRKKVDFIAGCLIAFAAELAFKRGYFGFVSLEPKTQLIDHYQNKYGFRQYGKYMAIYETASRALVDKYLNDG